MCAIRYQVSGDPIIVAHCHCKDCQQGSGSGHSTGAMFPLKAFKLTGQVAEYKLKSDNGNDVTRAFCRLCGSPIFGSNTGMPGYLTVTLGTLEDSANFEPQVVVFARDRQPWDALSGDALPTFDTQPDWKPEDGV
jgi:hypothetical protein